MLIKYNHYNRYNSYKNYMSSINDFSGYQPTWCPGCGNWGIGSAVKTALVQLNLDPSSVAMVFGIGCSGNMNDFINTYGFHSLHGRAVPTAAGIKLANHKLPVIVVVGDGDCYGEGGNHFIHACRGNHDITVIVHDNRVYGLTTGQAAPTSQKGFKSKSTPDGIIEIPVNPLSLAIVSGATFVAQAFAGNAPQMTEIIKKAVEHEGFSVVNVIQPCVTFNKVNTYQYYLQRIYQIDKKHDVANQEEALKRALEVNQERFPLGIIYEQEKPAYHNQIPQLGSGKSLVEKDYFDNLSLLLKDFL